MSGQAHLQGSTARSWWITCTPAGSAVHAFNEKPRGLVSFEVVEVVPRSVADALADALESIATSPYKARTTARQVARDALVAYRQDPLARDVAEMRRLTGSVEDRTRRIHGQDRG